MAGSYPTGKFQVSSTTVQGDIIASIMRDRTKRRRNHVVNEDKDNDGGKYFICNSKQPPFLSHFQDSSRTKYKLGDMKVWKDETYYFWDYSIHCNRLKWHSYTIEICRTRIR